MASSLFSNSFFASTIFSVLGEEAECLYIPAEDDRDSYTLSQYKFNESYTFIEVDEEGREFETTAPTAWVKESECPEDPLEDILEIRGKRYTVLVSERDGHGFVKLTLEKPR